MKKGKTLQGQKYKVHLDGYNLLPKLMEGKSTTADDNSNWPRKNFFYAADDGHISAVRMGDWKVMFTVNNCHSIETWQCQFEPLRLPLIMNLRQDPYEVAELEGIGYSKWRVEHIPYMYMAAAQTSEFLNTFVEFPPRQVPGSFSVDKIVEKMGIWERAQYK